MSKERDVGMKKCLKTKEMSRQKVSKEAVLTGNKKTGAKRKPCQENEMCREENVKRRRSQGKKMPKDKDAKGKRRQRKAAETTSASRGIDDTRKRLVTREEFVKSLASELSTRRAVKIQKCQEQAGSRESGSTRPRCREQEMSRTKTSKRLRSRRPCQPGGQGPFL